jgi:16S rRNA (adenine1518-N6/adenine1519-N6)-dimethyltransferase
MTAQTRSQVRELLERHGLSPRKALGQHFLADPNITAKIVATSGVGPGDRVVEIGPGTGTLTVALAETGARVVAYEIDESLRGLLTEVTAAHPNVELRFGDAMKVDFADELDGPDWTLVANLPYNVGTPLLLDVLRRVPEVRRMVVMVQLEVGRRLAASPGGKEYGLPSVVAQIHSQVRVAFTVPPQVFVPPPQVGSAVVVLDRVGSQPDSEAAVALAAAGFGQRRKMLRRSLAGVVADPDAALTAAGFAPESRAEELRPSDYLTLAGVLRG